MFNSIKNNALYFQLMCKQLCLVFIIENDFPWLCNLDLTKGANVIKDLLLHWYKKKFTLSNQSVWYCQTYLKIDGADKYKDNFGQTKRHLMINRELKYDLKTAIPIQLKKN